MPDIYALFMKLGAVERLHKQSADVTLVQEQKAVSALCTILNARCGKVKGLQLLISMMLIARSTGRQVRLKPKYTTQWDYTSIIHYRFLNHAGICMSYNSTWLYLRQLTTQARYTDAVCSGRWLWIYDNLNIHQRVRREHTGKGNQWLITVVSAHIV